MKQAKKRYNVTIEWGKKGKAMIFMSTALFYFLAIAISYSPIIHRRRHSPSDTHLSPRTLIQPYQIL